MMNHVNNMNITALTQNSLGRKNEIKWTVNEPV